ncbi:MAG TPA: gluconate 2-dehydrogenase subunit 3 family protein [Cellvibrio sp.]
MNNATQLIPSVAEHPDLPGEMDQSRRDAIKQLALMCGLALSASSLSALAAVVTPPTDMNRSTKTLLDKSQLALVRELGEIIIPTTDTPGAIAAGVHDFINHYVVYCASQEEQQGLLATLKRIEDSAQANAQKPFLLLSKEQQTDLLNNMEQAKNGFGQTDRNGFKQLKALVLFGYYTSEIGATQELAYLAIPGGYKGNFKFKEIGKAWALPQ